MNSRKLFHWINFFCIIFESSLLPATSLAKDCVLSTATCLVLLNKSIHISIKINLFIPTIYVSHYMFPNGSKKQMYRRCRGIFILVKRHYPYPAKLIYLNFQPLEVVSRYRDPRPQVVENYSYLLNLRTNIYKSLCLHSHFIPNNSGLIC